MSRPGRVLPGVAGAITAAAPVAAVAALGRGDTALALSLAGLGISLGPCLAVYALVSKQRKQAARRLVLFTGGLSIMAYSVTGALNLDLEGFFMLLLRGTMGAAVGHTVVTVIAGPLLFGRFLCGWGCWRAMILELLPVRGEPRRACGRRWSLLPYAGLAASAGAAAISVFALGHAAGGTPGAMHAASIPAILTGFAVYYAASIGLAFGWRDRRAFCKHLCPTSAILRWTSRPSLFKMTARQELCDGCGACSRACPMEIDVAGFAAARGGRVRSGQCILCQRCAHVCPHGALSLRAAY